MRSFAIVATLVAVAATPVQAQLADRLSQGKVPNALDRAVAQPRSIDPVRAAEDQRRSELATRDAQDRLGPVTGSTMTDGPAGVQGTGSGVSAAPPASAPPAPPTTPNR